MTYRVACEISDRITAIGAVSGNSIALELFYLLAGILGENKVGPGTYFPCNLAKKVPLLHIHGTSDDVISYYGKPPAGWKPVNDVIKSVKRIFV